MARIRLTENDLKRMVRNVVNEVLLHENVEVGVPGHDKYYFRCGWDSSYGGSNPFTAEGPTGGNFESLVEQMQKYVDGKLQEYEERKGMSQRALDAHLASAQSRHGKFSRTTQRNHEFKMKMKNKMYGTSYPEYFHPGGHDERMYDRYTKDIENEAENNKRWLEGELEINVELPTGDKNPNSFWGDYGWKRYAQSGPDSKTIKIDPNNVEASVKQAWDIFNEYAQRTPEVIGWFLWQWSVFRPTIRPILTPEVGEIIEGESDKISRFYNSLGYKGD